MGGFCVSLLCGIGVFALCFELASAGGSNPPLQNIFEKRQPNSDYAGRTKIPQNQLFIAIPNLSVVSSFCVRLLKTEIITSLANVVKCGELYPPAEASLCLEGGAVTHYSSYFIICGAS